MAAIVASGLAAASKVVSAAPTEQWKTKPFQCEGVKNEDWLYAVFCPVCAAAHAKSKVDQTHPIFNFFCFTPIGSYSMVRHSYGILGECGEDCLYGGLCTFCGVRQIWSEANIRGPIPGKYGQLTGQWSTELFQCECAELAKAAFCPFLVAHEVRALIHPQTNNWFDCFCLIPTSMYGQVRNTYGIGSEWNPVCEDLVVGAACYPCALNRALREAVYQRTLAATATVSGIANAAQAKIQQAGANALGKLGQLGKKGGGAGNPPPPGHMA